ncbi:MAG: hypothetical protein VX899_20600 [Myxococcota bacterium]|nr:hypothetical protein [Myxococcota bacterium]
MNKLLGAGAIAALALSTGCTVLGGSIAGSTLLGDGHSPWDQASSVSTVGQALVCLGASEPVDPADSYAFSGTILRTSGAPDGFDNLIPCWTDPAAVLVIDGDDGVIWTVGYAWLDQEGWDNTPWIDLWETQRVDITVAQGDGESAGFAVHQDQELIYAMEAGRDGQADIDTHIDGFEVEVGDSVGVVNTPCGERTALAVSYKTTLDRLTLFPDEDGALRIGVDPYTACNITSYELTGDGDCEDNPDTDVSWVVFNRAPTSFD